jgi:hypothetical protein
MMMHIYEILKIDQKLKDSSMMAESSWIDFSYGWSSSTNILSQSVGLVFVCNPVRYF